jgi:hypothetical protein
MAAARYVLVQPLGINIAVSELPAKACGYITFGCLNNFSKTNDRVLSLWARVLNAIPRSRLLILAHEGSHRQHACDVLSAAGVEPGRVEFASYRPRERYLELFHQVDISLDTVPYNGHTTGLDSFFMGVPVVTLVGGTVVGRAGASQLMNLRVPELIARPPTNMSRSHRRSPRMFLGSAPSEAHSANGCRAAPHGRSAIRAQRRSRPTGDVASLVCQRCAFRGSVTTPAHGKCNGPRLVTPPNQTSSCCSTAIDPTR